MKVVVCEKYGAPEVLHTVDMPKPTVKDGEILVKVKATAVTAADSRIRGARFPKGFGLFARLAFGMTKPRSKILGSTYSGVVETAGKSVTEFAVGDEVCGMTGTKMGTYAEYIVVSAFKSIAKKPGAVSHEDAAAMLFGGTAALYFLRDKLHIQKGETAVINGASGAVGTNAVQLAKYFGAEVTGVTSGENAELVKSLGAEAIIDFEKQNLADSGRKFDVILDTVGNLTPQIAKNIMTKTGRAGLMVAGLGVMLRARKPIVTGSATEKKEDIEFLLSLMAEGHLRSVIDNSYNLDDVVAAHTYADSGKKIGNLVLIP